MAKQTTTKHQPVEVRLELEGETYFLVPTLSAIKKINRHFGDMNTCFAKLQRADFDAMVFVAQVGADTHNASSKVIEEQLWRTGLAECIDALSEYVGLLIKPSGTGSGGSDAAAGDDEGNG